MGKHKIDKAFSDEEVMQELFNFIYSFQDDFEEFKIIYENEENTKVLSKYGNDFFVRIVDLYFENFILNISKLLDRYYQNPKNIKGNKNLTLFTVIHLLKSNSNIEEDKVNGIKKRVTDLQTRFENERDIRNKNLAHLDYSFMFKRNENSNTTEIEDIEHFLKEAYLILRDSYELLFEITTLRGRGVSKGNRTGLRFLLQNLKRLDA